MACDNGFTPTPVISHSIISYNKNNHKIADGIVITPSHNPPEDGELNITKVMEDRLTLIQQIG